MHQIYVVDTTIFNEPNTNTLHRYVYGRQYHLPNSTIST